MRNAASTILLTVFFTAVWGCQTGSREESLGYAAGGQNTARIDTLREELRAVRDERAAIERAGTPDAQGFFRSGESPLRSSRAMTTKERRDKVDSLIARGLELYGELSKRVEAELNAAIEQEFGPRQPLQIESIPLEAMDDRGNIVEVPVSVELRPLRRITDSQTAERLRLVMGPGRPTLAGYDGLPAHISPEETEYFRRIYTGEAAAAIAMEARSLVLLKGGVWDDPSEKERVANAIAVRGLDLDLGLHDNGNQTYDDTMYVVLEGGGKETAVVEYRATTESSSTRQGVGRLAACQVTYQRGLHKGRDPAFRLKGDRAEGTRRGREGTYEILGANLHSAYSSREFDSGTPLRPNVSLGCQVVATSKRLFESNVVKFLENEGVRDFPYTIVEDDEMALYDQMLRESSVQSVLVHAIDRAT